MSILPIKAMVIMVIGVTVLVFIAAGLDWLIIHPLVLIAILAAIGGGVYFLIQQRNARNRV